jgi:hypothetical protein
LRLAQCLELFGRRLQFEFSSQGHFHTSSIAVFNNFVKCGTLMKIMGKDGYRPTPLSQTLLNKRAVKLV